ncbi:MerR HTH family regulatory protein [Octadecabacter temperatus]|uniref:MerR family regulatory protein n=1 Tax=Octadecabacter temperatus TaxID=1458307 RepID=A0A0K0Y679_9RHOB|nr:MerR family transcriptional regulator [Octadecabacter temperatus]AKS46406.1 MerR family regulatory protein [Octadecabacter temperatus]SIO13394.1 MerR HTH family regulatory protein [Octadecabacter temperatus]
MSKSRDAFRTISEVSDALDTPAHVLRFWESKFNQVKPVKRAGGRRYYRPTDVDLLAGIKKLLHDDGMTIKGAQKLLREQGVKHVAALGAAVLDNEAEMADATVEAIEPVEVKTVEGPKAAPGPAVEQAPVDVKPVEAAAVPEAEVEIANVVPLTKAPGPALTLNLAPKADPVEPVAEPAEAVSETVTPAATSKMPDVPADPSDSDSKAPARLFHLLHKAPHDKIAAQAQAIAPLLDRMQVLRDRITLR